MQQRANAPKAPRGSLVPNRISRTFHAPASRRASAKRVVICDQNLRDAPRASITTHHEHRECRHLRPEFRVHSTRQLPDTPDPLELALELTPRISCPHLTPLRTRSSSNSNSTLPSDLSPNSNSIPPIPHLMSGCSPTRTELQPPLRPLCPLELERELASELEFELEQFTVWYIDLKEKFIVGGKGISSRMLERSLRHTLQRTILRMPVLESHLRALCVIHKCVHKRTRATNVAYAQNAAYGHNIARKTNAELRQTRATICKRAQTE